MDYTMISLLKFIFLIYLLSTAVLFAHSNKKKVIKSHEHGVGTLNIVQDENIIVFEFEIPGADIVGFEYKASDSKDIESVKNAINILSDYKNMIVPSGSSECKIVSSSAEVMYEGKHSEFLSNYKLNCKKIDKLKIIYIKYFKNFTNGKKLNIKVLGTKKKSSYVINNTKKILNVKGHF